MADLTFWEQLVWYRTRDRRHTTLKSLNCTRPKALARLIKIALIAFSRKRTYASNRFNLMSTRQ